MAPTLPAMRFPKNCWAIDRPASEIQFQAELQHPGRGRSGDLAKARTAQRCIWIAEIDLVEEIEEFRPQLQSHAFAQSPSSPWRSR